MIQKLFIAFIVLAALAMASAGSLCAQWVQTNGPGGAHVHALIASNGRVCAGTDEGLLVSTDHGQSWMIRNQSLTSVGAFASIGTLLIASSTTGDIHVSRDSGADWTKQDSGIYGISTLATVGTNLFGGTSGGVVRSTDSGSTWTWMSQGPSGSISAFMIEGSNLYAAGAAIFRSSDSGAYWEKLYEGNTDVVGLAAIGSHLFAVNDPAYSNNGNVLRSTDSGATWVAADSGLVSSTYAIIANGSNLFAGTLNGLYRSTNEGEIWSQITPGSVGPWIVSFAFDGANMFAGGKYSGIYRSTDSGEQWMEADHDLIYSSITVLAAIDTALFASVRYCGIYRSVDNGMNWNLEAAGMPSPDVISFAVMGEKAFVGTYSNGVFSSTDRGATWTHCDSETYPYITTLAVADTILYAEGGGFLMRSANAGKDWTRMGNTKIGGAEFILIAEGQILYAETYCDSANMPSKCGVFVSTNFGASWTASPNVMDVGALCISGNHLFAGTTNGVFFSDDSAATWTSVNSGLESYFVTAFAVSGTNLFAGTSNGRAFVSSNGGMSWSDVSVGLPSTPISSLLITNGFVFAGSRGLGVWRRPLSEMIGTGAVQEMPKVTQRLWSYPNPFSQSTQITFSPQLSGYAEVSIFNQLGVEVARLFSGGLDAGAQHTFTWNNPTALPDGVYECLIRMNGQVDRLPLVLVR